MPEATSLQEAWLASSGRRLEVDFGCHRGAFLLGMAEAYPESLFLGIEKQQARVERCLRKIHLRGLQNALALRGEGPQSLLEILPAASVATLYVSFPDPWPKRRHASRRLVTGTFLEACATVLAPEGVLRLMTDDGEYFSAMVRMLGSGWRETPWDDGLPRPLTTFEKTFLSLGKQPHRIAVTPLNRR